MTTNIRAAAQALLDALDNYILHPRTVGGNRRKQQLRTATNNTRAALAEPESAAADVPVVAWVDPRTLVDLQRTVGEGYTDLVMNDCLGRCTEPLIRQRDHLAAMEAMQQTIANQRAALIDTGRKLAGEA